MLTKIETRVVRQPDGRLRRDWYQSASADVVLLHDGETGNLVGFEIEWERRGCRRAYVSWTRGAGVRTGALDMGEEGGLHYKAAPMVLWDSKVRRERVEEARKLVSGSSIEEGLRESVLRRLEP